MIFMQRNTKTAIAVGMLIAFLALAPSLAFGQNTISVTTDKTAYAGTAVIHITGTVSPAPGAGTAALITVNNQRTGLLVDRAAATVAASTGAFSHDTTAGGPSWTTDTYVVTASWGATPSSTPITATATFSYTAAAAPGAPGALQLLMNVGAETPLLPGQAGKIIAQVYWNNGTLADVTFIVPHFHPPTGPHGLLGDPTNLPGHTKGMYFWSFPAQTDPGAYAVHLTATAAAGGSNFTVQGLTVITVSDKLAAASDLAALKTSLGTLSTDLATAKSSLSSDIAAARSSADAAKASADAAKSAVDTATASLSNISTFVLVVAALAAITLVLQIAILIRKART